jgi:hypothetical protein
MTTLRKEEMIAPNAKTHIDISKSMLNQALLLTKNQKSGIQAIRDMRHKPELP